MRRVWMAVSLLVIAVLLAGCFGGSSSPKVGGGLGGGSGSGPSLRKEEARIAELSQKLLQAVHEEELEELKRYIDDKILVRVTVQGVLAQLILELDESGEFETDGDKAISEWDYDADDDPYLTADVLGLPEWFLDVEQMVAIDKPFIDVNQLGALYSQEYRGYVSYLRPLGEPVPVRATLTLLWEKSEDDWRLTQIRWLIADEPGEYVDDRGLNREQAEQHVKQKMQRLAAVGSPDDLRELKDYFYDKVRVTYASASVETGFFDEEVRFEDFLESESLAYQLLIAPFSSEFAGYPMEEFITTSTIAGIIWVEYEFTVPVGEFDLAYPAFMYQWVFVDEYQDWRLFAVACYE